MAASVALPISRAHCRWGLNRIRGIAPAAIAPLEIAATVLSVEYAVATGTILMQTVSTLRVGMDQLVASSPSTA